MAIYTVFGALASLGVFRITDNLSSAIIVMGITVVLLYVVDPKIKLWLLAGLALILILIFAKPVLSKVLTAAGGFRMQRVLTWLSPESDASDSGFQTLQGLYAIGSGGFFGKGLGNSSQKIRLPEAQNDMIFSIVCEELGIFGMIILLVMFGYLLYRILFIAQNAPDWYGSLVTTGVFGQIAIQVILNLAVVTNVIPNTGISLPFISYGGTSLLFLMAEIGIVLNVSSGIKFEMDE
jgi:cell division protein FtsW